MAVQQDLHTAGAVSYQGRVYYGYIRKLTPKSITVRFRFKNGNAYEVTTKRVENTSAIRRSLKATGCAGWR